MSNSSTVFITGFLDNYGLNFSSFQLNQGKPAPGQTHTIEQGITKLEKVPSDIPGICHVNSIPEWHRILKLYSDESQPPTKHVYLVAGSDQSNNLFSTELDTSSTKLSGTTAGEGLLTRDTLSVADLGIEGLETHLMCQENAKAIAQLEEHCAKENLGTRQNALFLHPQEDQLKVLNLRHEPGTLRASSITKRSVNFETANTQIRELIETLGLKLENLKNPFGQLLTRPRQFLQTTIIPIINKIKTLINSDAQDAPAKLAAFMRFVDQVVQRDGGLAMPSKNDPLLSTELTDIRQVFDITNSNLAVIIKSVISKLVENTLGFLSSEQNDGSKIFLSPQLELLSTNGLGDLIKKCFGNLQIVTEDLGDNKPSTPDHAYISRWDNENNMSFFRRHNGAQLIATLHQKDLLQGSLT